MRLNLKKPLVEDNALVHASGGEDGAVDEIASELSVRSRDT